MNTARLLKYVWPFFNIMNERVSQIRQMTETNWNLSTEQTKNVQSQELIKTMYWLTKLHKVNGRGIRSRSLMSFLLSALLTLNKSRGACRILLNICDGYFLRKYLTDFSMEHLSLMFDMVLNMLWISLWILIVDLEHLFIPATRKVT